MDPFDDARGGSVARRRWLGAVAAAAIFIVSLLVPSAGNAAPDARAVPGAGALSAANSPGELARLEARAARLTRQYRGQLVLLTDAESAARSALARAARLRRQLGTARQEVARIAAASYMGGVRDPMTVIMSGGNNQRMLQDAATLQFVSCAAQRQGAGAGAAHGGRAAGPAGGPGQDGGTAPAGHRAGGPAAEGRTP